MMDKTFEPEVEQLQKYENRRKLRKSNLEYHQAQNRLNEESFRSLDASLKKNISFIKKLKTISYEQKDAILQEASSLKSDKYMGEIVASLLEAKLVRHVDFIAVVEFCSLMHERYAEFSNALWTQLLKSFGNPRLEKDEEKLSKLPKTRTLFRLVVEIYLSGLSTDLTSLYGILKDIVESDKNQGICAPLIASFLKQYGADFVGERERSFSEDRAASVYYLGTAPILQEQQQEKFRILLTSYFRSIEAHILIEHQKMLELEKENHEQYLSKGAIKDSDKQTYEKISKNFEKLTSSAQIMAEQLDLVLQSLPCEEKVTRMTHIAPVIGQNLERDLEKSTEDSPFEDDETKAFYQKITDIRQTLPPILFSDFDPNKGEDKEEDTEEQQNDFTINSKVEGKLAGLAWQSLVTKLSECNNLQRVDELALEFCYLNSKGNRKNLIQILAYNERAPVEMVPYYGRLAATLIKAIPEMETALISVLEEKFKNELSGKEAQKIQNRIYTVVFLSELVKFGIYPVSMIFNCIRILLDDFSMISVQILCRLLESCGRYLYKHKDTQSRMLNMLEILMRKRSTHHLDSRHQSLVEDAYFSCRPPDKSIERSKRRPHLQLYVQKLLYSDLDKKNVEQISTRLQKLPWKDPDTKYFLIQCFCKPWRVKYNLIRCLAEVLSNLVSFYSEFVLIVVDNILEMIRLDLESYTFKRHQKQISVLRYLGELFNYGIVNDQVIFNTLYTLITFAHQQGHAAPYILCSIDPPEDCFRIKLVCTLLETCGEYFDRGLLKKKLDIFLLYFQRYILTKSEIPLDFDFTIKDTFELLRPMIKMYTNFQEADKAVEAVERQHRTSELSDVIEGDEKPPSPTRRTSRKYSDEELDGLNDRTSVNSGLSVDENDDVSFETDQDEEDEEIRIIRNKMEEDHLQTLEFEKEFNAFLCENTESRKPESRKPVHLDMVIPSKLMHRENKEEIESVSFQESFPFNLLTKKGNRPQMKTMLVPSDSAFASSVLSKMEAKKAEQRELKQLVLGYEQRNGDDALEELTQVFNRRLHPFKKTGPRKDSYRSIR